MKIEIPEKLGTALKVQANAHGISAEGYAREVLERDLASSLEAQSSGPPFKTGRGMFAKYAVVQGADKFMPVDIHVPGCPPRPEALLHGFNKLQRLVRGQPDLGWRQRYNAVGTEEWARFEEGQPKPEAVERAALAVAPKHSETFRVPTSPAPSPGTPGGEAEDVAGGA